jgi:hypothetical protein
MWIVKLVTPPILGSFRDDFFPRKYRYQKDAKGLVAVVRDMGGTAVIAKIAK